MPGITRAPSPAPLPDSTNALSHTRCPLSLAYTHSLTSIHPLVQTQITQNKERVYQQHRIHNLITQIQARSKDLASIYEDTDAILKEEVAALRG